VFDDRRRHATPGRLLDEIAAATRRQEAVAFLEAHRDYLTRLDALTREQLLAQVESLLAEKFD
jgi:hypothetical protein